MRTIRVPGYALTSLEVLIQAVHHGCQVGVQTWPDPQGMERGIGETILARVDVGTHPDGDR